MSDNILYGLNGNIAIGYNIVLPEKYSLGDKDFDELNQYFSVSLRSLPIGSVFMKQDIVKEKKVDTSLFPEKTFLQRSYKKYFSDKPKLELQSNLFFILPNTFIEPKKLKSPFRPPQKKVFDNYNKKTDYFIKKVNAVVGYLKKVVLSSGNNILIEELKSDYLKDYYDYIFNGLEHTTVDIRNEWDYLRIGKKYGAILRFPNESQFPEEMNSSIIDKKLKKDKSIYYKNMGDSFGLDLPFEHIYTQVCVIDDRRKHVEKATKNNTNLKRFRYFDTTNTDYAEKTSKMLVQMSENESHETLVRGHNNILVLAPTIKELDARINLVGNAFDDIFIKSHRAFGDNLTALYEYSYPLNANMFVDEHYYVSTLEIFSAFLNLAGNYREDKQGVYFNSRVDNSPVLLDVWDGQKKYMNARNFFVISPTGNGKSFTINHILDSFYNQNMVSVIVDLGGSYKKLASLYKDDVVYITYVEGKPIGLNPFSLKNNKLTTDIVQELVQFLSVHIYRDRAMSEYERVNLSKFVVAYYQVEKSNHDFVGFINFFNKVKNIIVEKEEINPANFDINYIQTMLSEFLPSGLYGFLYASNEDTIGHEVYNKKIIVFELKDVKDNEMLLTIMIQLISVAIEKVIWKDKSVRGLLFFDEVAEQLKWKGMLRRIQWFYQAIRKQESCIGIALQSISQLPNDAGNLSKQIIDNTQEIYALVGEDYRDLVERFNLSEHAHYQLNSLGGDFNSKRPYSEIWIKRGKVNQVYRLEVSKEMWWAFNTEGAKDEELMNVYNQVNDLEKAIQIMINREKKQIIN